MPAKQHGGNNLETQSRVELLEAWLALTIGYGGIKTYRLSWYLTRVSANHASSNWAQMIKILSKTRANKDNGVIS